MSKLLLVRFVPQVLLGVLAVAGWTLFLYGNAALLKAGWLLPEVAAWVEPARWLWLGLGVLAFGLMFAVMARGKFNLLVPTIVFLLAVGVGTVGQAFVRAQFGEVPQAPTVVERKAANIAPEDWVLGVTVDGKSKAYPWALIQQQFVINDEVNGMSVVVMYCISCNSSLAFNAQFDGRTLQFGVVGEYHHETILHDVQTGNWWREDGTVIAGSMKGAQLEMLPAVLISWQDWLDLYPDTEIAM